MDSGNEHFSFIGQLHVFHYYWRDHYHFICKLKCMLTRGWCELSNLWQCKTWDNNLIWSDPEAVGYIWMVCTECLKMPTTMNELRNTSTTRGKTWVLFGKSINTQVKHSGRIMNWQKSNQIDTKKREILQMLLKTSPNSAVQK